MFVLQVRRALDRHAADHPVVDLVDLLLRQAELRQQIEPRLLVLLAWDPEPLVDRGADHPRRERLSDAEHTRQRAFGFLDIGRVQTLLEQERPRGVRRTRKRVRAAHVRYDLAELNLAIAEPLERVRHALIHDLEVAAACQLLELDEREVGLDPGRVAVHQQADRTGRC
jgi:hypothetical protein